MRIRRAQFIESFEDLVAFSGALAGVACLSADVGDFRVARLLNNAVGAMKMEGRVGVAGDGPSLLMQQAVAVSAADEESVTHICGASLFDPFIFMVCFACLLLRCSLRGEHPAHLLTHYVRRGCSGYRKYAPLNMAETVTVNRRAVSPEPHRERQRAWNGEVS